ncbi:MAG: ABC transporter ATP-binding protein [Parvibaculaceae bacterium]|nr:ABC transporter ATP-binding protein [Parvibaculaceae bacterium]HBM89606.1 ABC transporter ATP-binding protein [Rhodobiaceae bacterium]
MSPPPPAPNGPLLTLSGVSKSYNGDTPAVADVSLSIERGSFVSLVGPSGCGKSTLLRLIAGLLQPSHGTLDWEDGERPNDLGFVFQDATLLPWASAFDNVYLPLKLKGLSRDDADRRVKDALARVGLADASDKLPRELSGGMRMRVSIARALVTEPPVLLMDEPFAALDEFTREKLDDDLLTLWRDLGWTVIFVTHSVYESVYLSERILVMSSGSHGSGGPGQIADDVRIDAPYPRGLPFRQSSAYFDHCKGVSTALRDGDA